MNPDNSSKKNNNRIYFTIVIIGIIVATMLIYAHSMNANLKKQAYYAVQQNTDDIANEIDASIGFAKSSIRLTSQSATQSMDQEVIEDVNSILDPLLESTPFNFIEYILADGWNTMNDGGEPFDASDREYYKQGIQGNTGIWINYTPKKSKEVLLNFYTPLYYEGNIVGVFTGTLGGNTNIRPMLQSTFLGEEVIGFLCDEDGRIIASTVDGMEEGASLRTYLADDMKKSSTAEQEFRTHIDAKDDTAFTFREQGGNAVGSVSWVKNTGWYVVQIVPAKSLSNIMNVTTLQSILIAGGISLLFVVFLYFAGREEKRKTKQEIAEQRGIIEVLGKEYSSVYVVDTQTRCAYPYRLSEKMRRYYGQVSDSGIPWDEGGVKYANHFVKEEYREDFLQKSSIENLTSELKQVGDYFYYEYVNEYAGKQQVFRMIASLLPGDQEKNIVIGFADITEERENEIATQKALAKVYHSAEAANKAKSAFLFNMSHDIRTPMNAILGFTNKLEKCREDEAEFQHCVDSIKVSSEYLLDLINNVLNLARIESGKASLDDTSLWNIEKFGDKISTVFSEEFEKKNLSYYQSIDVEHSYVFMDTVKVEQIFINIVSNAVKYTPNGGEIHLTVTELPSEKEGYVCFKTVVEDNGIGMSKEFLPHIFDEFVRAKNSTESRIIGSGLGMGITKKMVDLMDGTISVESELGKGTRVTIVIPHKIATEKQVAETAETEIKKLDYSVFKGKRILLAEDNAMNAEIATELLKEAGFAVEHAEDGIICVDMLEKNEAGYYDLILMDIQMPNMDGYKATTIIRRLDEPGKKDIPIIAMTANAFEEDRKNALDAGMDEHVAKPVDAAKLFEVLMQVLKANV
ncbi:MAG: ATP-binding protein [Bariatricus sp.]